MDQSTHRIKDSGDELEIAFWPFFQGTFPNYELFWSEFLVELREDSKAAAIRSELPPRVILIAMAHYTIFRSLSYIHEMIDLSAVGQSRLRMVLETEKIKEAYTHFGIINEMVGMIGWLLLAIEAESSGKEVKALMKSPNELNEDFNNWIQKDYEKNFADFVDRNRRVNYTAHWPGDSLKMIAPSNAASYNDCFSSIRRRRNTIHRPDAGQCFDGNGQSWVPKTEFINDFELWPNMRNAFRDPTMRNKFQPLNETITADFERVVAQLNSLWDPLIEFYRNLRKSAPFVAWFNSKIQERKSPQANASPVNTATSSAPSNVYWGSSTHPGMSCYHGPIKKVEPDSANERS